MAAVLGNKHALPQMVQLEALDVKTVQVVLVSVLVFSRLAPLGMKVVRRTFLVLSSVAPLVIKVVLRIVLVMARLATSEMEVGTYVFESTIGYFEFIQNPVSFSPSFLLINHHYILLQ